MSMIPAEVNCICRLDRSLDPKSALAARIIIFTDLWQEGAYGINTGAKAAALAGCSKPLIDAARIILQAEDEVLLEQVLAGHVSLTAAAEAFRRRVRLIESFKNASDGDRIALGRSVGADRMFTDVVLPAL